MGVIYKYIIYGEGGGVVPESNDGDVERSHVLVLKGGLSEVIVRGRRCEPIVLKERGCVSG